MLKFKKETWPKNASLELMMLSNRGESKYKETYQGYERVQYV